MLLSNFIFRLAHNFDVDSIQLNHDESRTIELKGANKTINVHEIHFYCYRWLLIPLVCYSISNGGDVVFFIFSLFLFLCV